MTKFQITFFDASDSDREQEIIKVLKSLFSYGYEWAASGTKTNFISNRVYVLHINNYHIDKRIQYSMDLKPSIDKKTSFRNKKLWRMWAKKS